MGLPCMCRTFIKLHEHITQTLRIVSTATISVQVFLSKIMKKVRTEVVVELITGNF